MSNNYGMVQGIRPGYELHANTSAETYIYSEQQYKTEASTNV